jgi:hypothetical protein
MSLSSYVLRVLLFEAEHSKELYISSLTSFLFLLFSLMNPFKPGFIYTTHPTTPYKVTNYLYFINKVESTLSPI